MKNLVLIFYILIFLACDGPCINGYKNTTYPEEVWTRDLDQYVPMGSMRLNNYTSTIGEFCNETVNTSCQNPQNSSPSSFCSGQEFHYKSPCSSSINLGIVSREFDIVVPRVGPDLMIKIYINDLNSSSLKMYVKDRRIYLEIDFESQGTEIIGACHNNFFCFTGTPKFELDNMNIDIGFQLTIVNNRISYTDDLIVNINADFENSGMCRDNVFAFLCGDQRDLILSNIRSGIRDQLLKNENRTLISTTLHAAIINSTNLNTTGIRSISIDDSNDLVVNVPCNAEA